LRHEERPRTRPPALGRPAPGTTSIPCRPIRPVAVTGGPLRHRRHAAPPAPAFPRVVGRPGGLGAGLAAHARRGLISGLRPDALDADGRSDKSGPAGAIARRSPVGGHPGRRRRSKDRADPDAGGHGDERRRIGGQRISFPSGRVAAICVQRGWRGLSGCRLAGASSRPADAGRRARCHLGHCATNLGSATRVGGRARPGGHPHRHHRPERRLWDRRGHLRRGLRCRCAPAATDAERRWNPDGGSVDGRRIPSSPPRETAVGHLLDRPQRHDLRHAPCRVPGAGAPPLRRRCWRRRSPVRRAGGWCADRLAVHGLVQSRSPSGKSYHGG
jgi:hypothetical protein